MSNTEQSEDRVAPASSPRRTAVTLALVGLGFAVALVATVLALGGVGDDASGSPRDAVVAGADRAAGGKTTAPAVGSTPSRSGAPGPASGAPQPSDDAQDGTSSNGGTEVLPPADDPGDLLPGLTERGPLVAGPLPASASAQGRLVDGFPSDVMAPTVESDVVESSISGDGTTMQVSLTARTDASPDEVSDRYASLWESFGVFSQGGSADRPALTFVGPHESLSLGFASSTGTGTVYYVLGVFRTE